MNHLLSSKDWDLPKMQALFDRADEFLTLVLDRRKTNLAEGKILATLFYEQSTRTRFSFETAMLRLGGAVISNPEMNQSSSAKKGESLYDTGKTVSQFADVIAVRHPMAGSVSELARGSEVPVINAGDGPNDHPTQGLLDLYTLHRELGHLDHLTIGILGDLKHSRVAHAQCELLAQFEGQNFIFISSPELKMPEEIKEMLQKRGFEVRECSRIEEALPECDVLSLTRIQEERFSSREEYLKQKGQYVFRAEHLNQAKPNLAIIDPLPRVDHIELEVDEDPRAKYFKQVQYGVAVRMAILAQALGL